MNLFNPDRISAKERLAEVAPLLAMCLIRLRARQSREIFARSEQ